MPLDAGDERPLIYISLGTIFYRAPEFYRACFEAFGGEPCRVLVATGPQDTSEWGPVPANFTLQTFVPQLEVLRQASVFLTHGGMNSVSEALWFGVPLMVFPQHGDQHLVAAQVEALRAGVRIAPGEIEPARLREALRDVMNDPGFRRNAGIIQASFREAGGPVRAAHSIRSFGKNAQADRG
jgi:MGT family glycosyltransferase